MAYVLTDGFETYDNSDNQYTTKWTTESGVSESSVARTGNRSVGGSGNLTKTAASPHGTFIAGLALRVGTAANADLIRFLSDSGATEHIVLRRTTSGDLAIDRGSTQLAITTNHPIPDDLVFRYIEIKAVLSDTVGTIDVYLNGVHSTPILTFSGDTKNAGTMTTLDTFWISGGTGGLIDDVYLLTGDGSAPYNDLLGEVRCYPLAPTASGNSSQLLGSDGNSTNNYLLIDEAAASTSTSDYVASATDGQKDTYVYGNIPSATGSVLCVEVASQVAKDDAGAKSIRHLVRHSGTDYAGSDLSLTITRNRAAEVYLTNPGTAAQWTKSEVDAAEFGVEVRP